MYFTNKINSPTVGACCESHFFLFNPVPGSAKAKWRPPSAMGSFYALLLIAIFSPAAAPWDVLVICRVLCVSHILVASNDLT